MVTYATGRISWIRLKDKMTLKIFVVLLSALAPHLIIQKAVLANTIPSLVEEWYEANRDCRGSTNPQISIAGCSRRAQLQRRLRANGMCFGRPGESGYQMGWHVCGF